MNRSIVYILNADTDRHEFQGANLANLIHGELFENPRAENELAVATYNVHQGRLPILGEEGEPAGIIITGSFVNVRSGQPDSAPWVSDLARYLEHFMDRYRAPIPLLGVCFGHQILSMIYGYTVEPIGHDRDENPIYEVGYPEIMLSAEGVNCPLFEGLPRTFRANESHRNRVVDSVSPPLVFYTRQTANFFQPTEVVFGLRANDGFVLATNASGIQAISLSGGRCLGIQFHPEIYINSAQQSLERKIAGLPPSLARQRLEDALERMPAEYAQSNANAAARIYHNFVNHYVLPGR